MNKIFNILAAAVLMAVATACNDSTSYADLINDENKAVNRFLVDQRVIGSIPPDSVFEYGENAPYYQMDPEGNIYMKVVNPGNLNDRPQDDDLVYFRFLCSNLSNYTTVNEMIWTGNALNLDQVNPTSFRFNNYSLQSSLIWGSGIQLPLHYLGFNCEVYLIIKSQYGPTDNISTVQPYVYNISYYRSQI